MPRSMSKLSNSKVAKLTEPGSYSDGGGLYLQLSRLGGKSWIFKYKIRGREREMGLGPAHTITLAEARALANACRHQRLQGLDPIEERRKQRQELQQSGMTFKACAEAYMDSRREGWRSAEHERQWGATMEADVYPVFGATLVQHVDTDQVLKALKPIWKTKTETASRIRGRIEAVLDWAKTMKHRQGENPARWKGHLENLLPKKSKITRVEHHPALPYTEAGLFMAQLRQQQTSTAQAVEFTILTAARSGETRGATRGEFNADATIWTIPAGRMKGEREHRVPLSTVASALVKRVLASHSDDLLFPGRKAGQPLSIMAMTKLLQRMNRDDITVHGFRSTFRDWAAECTESLREVAEMALAHVISDEVEAAYRRGDLFEKRKLLMEQWALFCGRSVFAK